MVDEKELNKILDAHEEGLKQATTDGMRIGAKAISQVILNKVKNVDKTMSRNDMFRLLKEVKRFAEIAVNHEEK